MLYYSVRKISYLVYVTVSEETGYERKTENTDNSN